MHIARQSSAGKSKSGQQHRFGPHTWFQTQQLPDTLAIGSYLVADVAKFIRELSMLRFNTRWVLAMAAGFTLFQGVGPWTNSLADHAVFLLIGTGFLAGLLAHWRYIG